MTYRDLFFFAAKAGSLEGYLYQRDKLDKLDDWVNNIVKLHQGLPAEVKAQIRDDLKTVLERCLSNGEKSLPSTLKAKLASLFTQL